MAPSPTGLLRRFGRDRRAVSAVEFALCLPFMLLLYLGGIQLSQAVSADRKVTLLARTVGDLVAQVSSVTTSDVGGIFNAASAVLYPFPLTSGASLVDVKLYEIWTAANADGTTTSYLEWSCEGSSDLSNPTCSAATGYSTADCAIDTSLGTPPTVTIPAPEDQQATVKAVVTYSWSPTIAYNVIGPITLSQTIYLRPRLSTRVCWTAT